MLKGIPDILSPDLLKIMMEMGHGEEIVLGDGNFPSAGLAVRLVRADGHGIPELLDAMLKFFPLDTYVEKPVSLMNVVPGDITIPSVWNRYEDIIGAYDKRGKKCIGSVDRSDFYDRARKAYAVVATSEKALYGNIILKKGVVTEDDVQGIKACSTD
jgi:L-fucose mutarotase